MTKKTTKTEAPKKMDDYKGDALRGFIGQVALANTPIQYRPNIKELQLEQVREAAQKKQPAKTRKK